MKLEYRKDRKQVHMVDLRFTVHQHDVAGEDISQKRRMDSTYINAGKAFNRKHLFLDYQDMQPMPIGSSVVYLDMKFPSLEIISWIH